MRTTWMAGLVGLGLLVAGCGDDETMASGGAGAGGSSGQGGAAGAAGTGGAAGVAGSGGAGGQAGASDAHPDCDPLVPEDCGFPFPSNYYLVDDAKMPSGKRVQFGATTLPKYQKTKQVDPSAWTDCDGFSPGQGPMTILRGATVEGLPTQDTIDDSLKTTSPTVLIDAETGELVPHFSELDMTSSDENDRVFMLRPVVRLKDRTRYIVAIRGVVDKEKKALEPAASFKALRDKAPSGEASIEARRALYEDIFGRLEKAGVERESLQIAWDYTTASTENNTRTLLYMRDKALALVGDKGPSYTIDETIEQPNADTRRIVRGKMKVPLFVDKPGPGGVMTFDADGLPVQHGEADYPFLLIIPESATKEAAPILQQGHGLLGSRNDAAEEGWVAPFLNEQNFALIATDWIGLAQEDEDYIAGKIVEDIGTLRSMFDRQQQGVINALLAMRMVSGSLWNDDVAKVDGKATIDPTKRYYRGDSQGGILGATYMALTTDVERGLLGVPGMPYNLLLNRSVDFNDFFDLFKVGYGTYAHIQIALGLVQMHWDRVEPNGFVPFIRGNPLPNTPDHNVMLHVAIADHQVTPLGAHVMARALKAKNLSPSPRPIWGLDDRTAPVEGEPVIVEFDYQHPEVPKTNTPPTEPKSMDTHSKPRKSKAAQAQTSKFLREGVVIQTCDGACDPE